MSEENRNSTTQIVENGDVHPSSDSASVGEDNLQSQLLDHRLSWSELDGRINDAISDAIRLVNPVSEGTPQEKFEPLDQR